MKRLLIGVKNILECVLVVLIAIFAPVLKFSRFIITTAPLVLSIPMSILCTGGFIAGVLKGDTKDWGLWFILIIGIIFLISIIYDIYYKILIKKESNCLKRLKLQLTDEFQEVQIRYGCRKKDLANIAVEKAPYVFKARIKWGSIEYQFETKDGEVFYSGETSDYLWFEKNIYL